MERAHHGERGDLGAHGNKRCGEPRDASLLAIRRCHPGERPAALSAPSALAFADSGRVRLYRIKTDMAWLDHVVIFINSIG